MAKVVIQNKKNFKYVRTAEDWAEQPSEAMDFQKIEDAARFCREHGLKDVYIVHGKFDRATNRFDASSKTMLEVPRVRSREGAGG